MKTAKKNTTSPLGEPINIFAPGCAVRIMPDDFVAGGTLERAEPVGGGLVCRWHWQAVLFPLPILPRRLHVELDAVYL